MGRAGHRAPLDGFRRRAASRARAGSHAVGVYAGRRRSARRRAARRDLTCRRRRRRLSHLSHDVLLRQADATVEPRAADPPVQTRPRSPPGISRRRRQCRTARTLDERRSRTRSRRYAAALLVPRRRHVPREVRPVHVDGGGGRAALAAAFFSAAAKGVLRFGHMLLGPGALLDGWRGVYVAYFSAMYPAVVAWKAFRGPSTTLRYAQDDDRR